MSHYKHVEGMNMESMGKSLYKYGEWEQVQSWVAGKVEG